MGGVIMTLYWEKNDCENDDIYIKNYIYIYIYNFN